ncbi:hypothetical protein [Chryseobacterium sp.]|uniref:hypothetical protein n=1 Tax=Chryseobacterium sp. TaxID=1871047 RepID=UPI002FC65D25
MKKTFSIILIFTVLTFSFLNINSCSNRDDTVSCFPLSTINVNLNLNLAAYNNLNFVGQPIYIDEQQSGTRGLIVVRTLDNPASFKVYDRNAPHLCPDINTTLEIKNGNSIFCPKDNATWILITGQPTAVANLPPKTYFWNYDPSTKNLSLYN